MGSPINTLGNPDFLTGVPAPDQQQPRDATMDMLQANGAQLLPPNPPKPGRLKSLLMNMAQGAAIAGGYEAGIPQALNLQSETNARRAEQPYIAPSRQAQIRLQTAQAQEVELNNQITQHRIAALQNITQGNDPFASLGQLTPDEQAVADGAIQQARMTGDFKAIPEAIGKIYQQRTIFGRTTRGDITVPAELAVQYPSLAPFVGKNINLTQFAAALRGEAISNKPMQTAAGPVVVPTTGPNKGQATPVTVNGKGIMSNQQAGAYWQAKYGLAKTVDENGAPINISRLDAQGTPVPDNAFNIFKGKAGLDNFKDALGRISQNMDVMNDPSQRALIAQTLRNIGTVHDPGIISSIVGGAVASGLDPKAADLVAATLNAREWIGANRSFAGNFQGSEALYNRMVANIAGPMNSPEVNRALIKQDIDNTNRIEDRIVKFQGGGKTPKSSGGGQVINYKIVNGQLVPVK